MAKQNGFIAALFTALFLITSGGLMGCGGSKGTPPEYPVPEARPVEETSLAPYLGEDEELDLDGYDAFEQDEEEAIEEEAQPES